jgi:predicted Zn-dependent protease
MTETRLKDIRKGATSLKPEAKPPIAADGAALFQKLDGLWWGENPHNGVFQKNQFLHPSIGFTITFPIGWKNRNTPQYIISVQTNKEAILLLGVAEKASDPEVAGEKFVKAMRAKAGVEPASTSKLSVGEFPAYVVSYLDRSGGKLVYLHFAWVTMAGKTYELIGMAPEKHRDMLKAAALSLRPLTDAERGTVTGKRLRIVAAQQGERLENLTARTGNAWPPAYTAIVNGLSGEAVLSAGQLVKIARVEPVQH